MSNGQILRQGLDQSQKLGTSLSPRLQQQMRWLKHSHAELLESLREEAEKNPLLELTEPGEETKDKGPNEPSQSLEIPEANQLLGPASPGTESSPDDFQAFCAYVMDAQDNHYSEINSHFDGDDDNNLEEYVESRPSLVEHLSSQLRLSECSVGERKVGEYLIGLLDRNGWLVIEEDEVISHLCITKDLLERVVGVIQSFDPPGVGARNLEECLLIQYRMLPNPNPLVLRMIGSHLENLARNKLPQIAHQERVAIEYAKECYEEIRQLDPKPGLHYSSDQKVHYITPDVLVEITNGELLVTMNEKCVPNLRINAFCQAVLRSEKVTPSETYEFIKKRLNAARATLESLAYRGNTIVAVTRRIFEIQFAFLEIGIAGLIPLTLKQVADDCGFHESTISRVTTEKYVQTPRGLFQLKFFFSGGTTTTTGDEISSRQVHHIIREILANEDPRRPLADEKVKALLKDMGIEIARRTVAKYREELGILSTSKRKVHTS